MQQQQAQLRLAKEHKRPSRGGSGSGQEHSALAEDLHPTPRAYNVAYNCLQLQDWTPSPGFHTAHIHTRRQIYTLNKSLKMKESQWQKIGKRKVNEAGM